MAMKAHHSTWIRPAEVLRSNSIWLSQDGFWGYPQEKTDAFHGAPLAGDDTPGMFGQCQMMIVDMGYLNKLAFPHSSSFKISTLQNHAAESLVLVCKLIPGCWLHGTVTGTRLRNWLVRSHMVSISSYIFLSCKTRNIDALVDSRGCSNFIINLSFETRCPPEDPKIRQERVPQRVEALRSAQVEYPALWCLFLVPKRWYSWVNTEVIQMDYWLVVWNIFYFSHI